MISIILKLGKVILIEILSANIKFKYMNTSNNISYNGKRNGNKKIMNVIGKITVVVIKIKITLLRMDNKLTELFKLTVIGSVPINDIIDSIMLCFNVLNFSTYLLNIIKKNDTRKLRIKPVIYI